ncbi:MAG: hypothetical protein RLZZ618_249 [Pseudomonadota bacterium]|jgi:uncharacterized protein YdgA (DUF945 family)
MSKIVVGAVVLAVVAGGGVATAKWSGGKVADELHAQTEKTLKAFPAVKIVKHSVVKGWVKSTHEITVEIGCATVPAADAPAGTVAKGPVQITWRDTISHGPLPGFRSVGLAAIDSQLVLPPEASAQIAKVLGDKPLFTLRTVVGFGGGYSSDLASPAFKFAGPNNEGTIDWKGLTATVKGDLNKGIAGGGSFKLDAPGMVLDVAKGGDVSQSVNVKLGAISMRSDIPANDGSTVWLAPSKGTGSIASLDITTNAAGKPVVVGLSDLKLASETKLDKGLLSTASSFTGKGRVDSFSVDKVEMNVSLKNLHAPTYEKLMGTIMSKGLSCDKGNEADVDEIIKTEMLAAMTTLLQYNPEYALDKLAIEIGGKRAELAYNLAIRGVTPADAATPAEELFKTKGFLSASVNVQKSLIEEIIKKVVAMKTPQDGTAIDPEAAKQEQAMMMSMVDGGIAQGVAQGFIKVEGDAVKASAKYEAGQLTLNDKVIPLPGAAGG